MPTSPMEVGTRFFRGENLISADRAYLLTTKVYNNRKVGKGAG